MSRVQGHGVCLKSNSRIITMQAFMILAIIETEKDNLVFYLMQIVDGGTDGRKAELLYRTML